MELDLFRQNDEAVHLFEFFPLKSGNCSHLFASHTPGAANTESSDFRMDLSTLSCGLARMLSVTHCFKDVWRLIQRKKNNEI